tara:strand:+ start:469 stop:750 length:282 start_codon:yes stop_codon:yes gene_type:complete
VREELRGRYYLGSYYLTIDNLLFGGGQMETRYTKLLVWACVAASFLFILGACVDITAVEVGDCIFYVSPGTDLLLSYEIILACADKLVVNIVL